MSDSFCKLNERETFLFIIFHYMNNILQSYSEKVRYYNEQYNNDAIDRIIYGFMQSIKF